MALDKSIWWCLTFFQAHTHVLNIVVTRLAMGVPAWSSDLLDTSTGVRGRNRAMLVEPDANSTIALLCYDGWVHHTTGRHRRITQWTRPKLHEWCHLPSRRHADVRASSLCWRSSRATWSEVVWILWSTTLFQAARDWQHTTCNL